MAVNIFEKYGIKEVANIYFQDIESKEIVLFLDSLKVSTIETTAETADARGGWGNPKLVSWDYGKEITVTLEDALMSFESLRLMLGGALIEPDTDKKVTVNFTEQGVVQTANTIPTLYDHLDASVSYDLSGKACHYINLSTGVRGEVIPGSGSDAKAFVGAVGDTVRFFWTEELSGTEGEDTDAVEITISPNTFAGTYRIVGDTFIRSEKTGKDEAFQFVIGKAKVSSEVTITLEAEGDPSTFSMTLNVLRSTNERGEYEMMKLIRYNPIASE